MFLVSDLKQSKTDKINTSNTSEFQPPSLGWEKVLLIDHKQYVPAGQIAREFGYELSHVSYLARTGKIDAVQRNGRWFMNIQSVIRYRESAEKNKIQGGLKSVSVLSSAPSSDPSRKAGSKVSSSEEHLSQRPNLYKRAVRFMLVGFLILMISQLPVDKTPHTKADILSAFKNFYYTFFTEPEVGLWLNTDRLIERLRELEEKQSVAGLPDPVAQTTPTPTPIDGGSPGVSSQSPTRTETIVREIITGPSAITLARFESRLGDSESQLEELKNALAGLNAAVSDMQNIRPAIPVVPYYGTGTPQFAIGADSMTTRVLTVTESAEIANLTITGGSASLSNLSVSGNADFAGNATIGGDLFVLGNIGIGTTLAPVEFTVIGSSSFSGRLDLTRNPINPHLGTWPAFSNTQDATLYINPDNPVADGNVIVYADNGSPRFVVDAEGDIYGNNLILTGSTTTGATTIAGDLTVEANTTFGDASTDEIYFVGTIKPKTLVSNLFTIQSSPSWAGDYYLNVVDSSSNPIFNVASTGNVFFGGSIATSLTPGSVPFIASDGSFDEDNANFFWDNSTKRLGVGTNNPLGTVHIVGNDPVAFPVLVEDELGFAVVASTQDFGFVHTNSTTGAGLVEFGTWCCTFGGASGGWFGTISNHDLHFFTNNSAAKMTLTTGGNVGIGTSSPQATLELGAGHMRLADSGQVQWGSSSQARVYGSSGPTGHVTIGTNGSDVFSVRAGGDVHMAYNGGNVGINDTTPTQKLDVAGNIQVRQNDQILLNEGGGGGTWITNSNTNVGTGDGHSIQFWSASNKLFEIGTNGVLWNQNGSGDRFFELRPSNGQISSVFRIRQNPNQGSGLLFGVDGAGSVFASKSANFGLGFSTATVSYNRFGTTTTNHSLANSSDVLISGRLEVDGQTFFDGGTTFNAATTFNSGASISGNFDPSTDDTYDLGQNDLRWRDLYLGPGSLHIGSNTSDEFTISYNTTDNRLDFDANAGASPDLSINSVGNVGINTTTPSRTFEVRGIARFRGATGGAHLELTDGSVFHNIGFEGAISGGGSDNLLINAGGITRDIVLQTNSTPRLTVDSGGSIGIGTTTPATADANSRPVVLDLATGGAVLANNTALSFRNTTLSTAWPVVWVNSSDQLLIGDINNVFGGARFLAGGGQKMFLDSAGNVGIGNGITATQKLDVRGRVTISNASVPDNAYNGDLVITKPAASGQFINLIRSGQSVWSIGYVYNTNTFAIGTGNPTDSSFTDPQFVVNTSGNVGIGSTSPDRKLSLVGAVGVLSGGATTNTDIAIGRSSLEANFAVAGAGGAYSDFATQGDVILRNTTSDIIITSRNLSGAIRFGTGSSDTEKVTIIANGNVGIGTSAPLAKLNLDLPTAGNTTDPIQRWGWTNSSWYLQLNQQHVSGSHIQWNFVDQSGNNLLAFRTGNVGINTTTPLARLAIGGTGAVFGVDNGSTFQARNNGGTYETYLWPRWTDNIMYLNYGSGGFNIRNNGSVSTMFMDNTGNVGIGTSGLAVRLALFQNADTFILSIIDSDGNCAVNPESTALSISCSSDERLKTNITPAGSKLDYLRGIPLREYDLIASGDHHIGTVAQELLTIDEYSHLVTTDPATGYYMVEAISQWEIIKGIQELADKSDNLEARMEDLESGSAKPMAVSLENGLIRPGDRLTEGSVPGVLVKATQEGMTLAVALEPMTSVASGSYGTIMAVSDPRHWKPGALVTGYEIEPLPVEPQGEPAFDLAGSFDYVIAKLADAYEIVIERGVLKVASIITETLTTKKLSAEELELKDEATGEIYCVKIINGDWNKVPGACVSPTPSPVLSDTPIYSATPTPSTSPSPETTPEITPELEISPTPEATPTPVESSTPSPTPTRIQTPEVTPTPSPVSIPDTTPDTTSESTPTLPLGEPVI